MRGEVWEQLTNLGTFFQNNYSDFFALFFLELFQPDRCAETCRPGSNDAYVDLVLRPLYVGRIKNFPSSERCRVELPVRNEPPSYELLRSPSEHCGMLCSMVRDRSRVSRLNHVQHSSERNIQHVTGQDGFGVGYEQNSLRGIDHDPGPIYRLPNLEIVQ